MLLDPNAYGGLLVMALVIMEGGSWGPAPLFSEPAVWFCRISLGLGILFTFSRSAWVALALSMLLLCAIRIRVAGRLGLAALAGAPCVLLVMGRGFLGVFQEMASRPKQVQGRFDLIHDAFFAFARHPLFGGGIGSFRLSEGEIAHNSAMWFLADFGIVGLAALVGFLGWFFVKGWFAYRFAPMREQPVALALLLAHTAMVGLAMGIEAFYQRHWWVAFGLIASGLLTGASPVGRSTRASDEEYGMTAYARNDRVRVLHIIGDSCYGGIARIILGLGRTAQAEGWQVDVLTTNPVVQEAFARQSLGIVNLDVIRREMRPFWDLMGLIRLSRFLRRQRYQIVHTHTSKGGLRGQTRRVARGRADRCAYRARVCDS